MPSKKLVQDLPLGYVQFNDDLSPDGVFVGSGANRKWFCADVASADSIEERLHNFFDVMRERHAIYLRRAAGIPKPWTNDPILRDNKFCCTYRELDRVSLWITENIIKPFEDNKNLPFLIAAARLINWPDSLAELLESGALPTKGKWDPDLAYRVLKAKSARKGVDGKMITGAYIINSIIPKNHATTDRSKAYYIPYIGLQNVWNRRNELFKAGHDSLEAYVTTMKSCSGWGPFLAYQCGIDASYSDKWLGKAHDLNTYNSAGPGTCRGLSRVFHNEKFVRMDAVEKTRLISFQIKASQNTCYWPHTSSDMKTGFSPLSMANMSSANCETDKYFRLILGQGRMKSKYPGSPSRPDTQRSLF